MITNETKAKMNRLAQISKEQAALKAEKDALDMFFVGLADTELRSSKKKSVAYAADNLRVTVTLAKKVTLTRDSQSESMLLSWKNDILKTETKTTLSAMGQRMLGGVALGEFDTQDVSEVLKQICPDKEQLALLEKKVCGRNYENDIRYLMAITGCSYERAAEDAYFILEAAVWQELRRILMGNKIPEGEWQAIIDKIRADVLVEEIPRVKIEY